MRASKPWKKSRKRLQRKLPRESSCLKNRRRNWRLKRRKRQNTNWRTSRPTSSTRWQITRLVALSCVRPITKYPLELPKRFGRQTTKLTPAGCRTSTFSSPSLILRISMTPRNESRRLWPSRNPFQLKWTQSRALMVGRLENQLFTRVRTRRASIKCGS